jgi:hypothetical protein
MRAVDSSLVGHVRFFAGYGPFTPLLPLTAAKQDLLLEAIAALRLELQEETDARYRNDDQFTALGQLADEIEALG